MSSRPDMRPLLSMGPTKESVCDCPRQPADQSGTRHVAGCMSMREIQNLNQWWHAFSHATSGSEAEDGRGYLNLLPRLT
eukprot:486425-Hanusia_phi.AAC.3